MHKNLDITWDEVLERNSNARLYSAGAAMRDLRKVRKFERFVKRLFTGSVLFFVWAVLLSLLVGAV